MIESATYSLKQAFVSSTQDRVATVGQAQSRGGELVNQAQAEKINERLDKMMQMMQRVDQFGQKVDQIS